VAERLKLCRFLTVTLDPGKIRGNPVRYLRDVFSKWRTYTYRKFGQPISYICVLEFHKSGIPHLHILVDRFISQQWISESWQSVGGGRMVFIEHVNVRRVSAYVSKYLTEELMLSAPPRSRRVTVSRSIQLLEKRKSDYQWRLDRRSIFVLFAIVGNHATDVRLDAEQFLLSFCSTPGFDVPPWKT
jgi:hypothetical protein